MRPAPGVARHRKKKRIMKAVKGYYGRRHLLLRLGIEAVKTADKYAYIGRKRRKRDFRTLWIVRIGAACRPLGLTYSQLISGLSKAELPIDRKQLAELAIREPKAFEALVAKAKEFVTAPKAKAAAK